MCKRFWRPNEGISISKAAETIFNTSCCHNYRGQSTLLTSGQGEGWLSLYMGLEVLFFSLRCASHTIRLWCLAPPNFFVHPHVPVGGIPLEMMVIRVPFSMQQYDVRDPRARALFRCFLVAGRMIYILTTWTSALWLRLPTAWRVLQLIDHLKYSVGLLYHHHFEGGCGPAHGGRCANLHSIWNERVVVGVGRVFCPQKLFAHIYTYKCTNFSSDVEDATSLTRIIIPMDCFVHLHWWSS